MTPELSKVHRPKIVVGQNHFDHVQVPVGPEAVYQSVGPLLFQVEGGDPGEVPVGKLGDAGCGALGMGSNKSDFLDVQVLIIS